MQTSVSDHYATELARSFYANLVLRELHLPSRALADARREIEAERLKAVRRDEPLEQTQPEYATSTLYLAGEESPIADFGLTQVPLSARPVHEFPDPSLSSAWTT